MECQAGNVTKDAAKNGHFAQYKRRTHCKLENPSEILVGAAISCPVILKQNHIGKADIFPAKQGKFETLLKFRAGG